jgi:hypothetical protein
MGFPEIIIGQSTADVHHVNQVPKANPVRPKMKVTQGIKERGIPIASSMP